MTKNYKVLNDCTGMYEEEIMETLYESRGIKDIEHFLNPIEEDMLPLEDLINIDKAAQLINDAVENNQKITVLADVDTDGVTSGTIMTRYLRDMNANVNCEINQGKKHGLIGQDLSRFQNSELVIIVDSLDKNISQYQKLFEDGKQIIVLDHHAIKSDVDYDSVVTLVSSQRDYDNPNLSGAGVVLKMCLYLDQLNLTDYADQYFDLAAVGILADVMDVSEESYENRYIIFRGLKNLVNASIKKVIGGFNFNSKSVLFSLAPIINSCCRCGDNKTAISLFLEDDNKEILRLKKIMESYKALQGEEVDRLLPGIEKQIEEQKDESVILLNVETQYGISGLIGNKILERVNRPLFVISAQDNDNYYGSMRSIGTEDFRKMINDTKLAEADGHENAAGITIPKKNMDKFIKKIRNSVKKINLDTTENINIDAEISINEMTSTLVQKVNEFNFISGYGSKPLLFKVTGLDNYSVSSWSEGKHLLLNYEDNCRTFIQWNTNPDNFDDMEDHSLMGDEVIGYGELESSWVGKRFMLKLILNDFEVV